MALSALLRSGIRRVHTPLLAAALLLPAAESYALLHRTVAWRAAAELHLGTLLLTLVVCVTAAHAIPVRQRATALTLAVLDVAGQWYWGSDYLVQSTFQPLHIAALSGVLFVMAKTRPSDPVDSAAVSIVAPALVGWGVAAAWSPFVTLTAENYGGGDRLIGPGITALMGMTATLVFLGRRWQRVDGRPVVWLLAVALFALQQAALGESARFLPVFVCSGIVPLLVLRSRPQATLAAYAPLAVLFAAGYLLTLRYTSLLAWNITVWFGAVVLCTLLALVVAAAPLETEERA